ncbi:MAG: flagellar biosynthetic protein FliO [Oscillospiraceae bacterium]
MEWSEVVSIIGTILLMVAVFVGAYFVSKFVGKRYQPRYGFQKNIKILETTPIGKDRALMLVKAGEKVFLLGSTHSQFSLLSELDPQAFTETPEREPIIKKDFVSAMRDAIKNRNLK